MWVGEELESLGGGRLSGGGTYRGLLGGVAAGHSLAHQTEIE